VLPGVPVGDQPPVDPGPLKLLVAQRLRDLSESFGERDLAATELQRDLAAEKPDAAALPGAAGDPLIHEVLAKIGELELLVIEPVGRDARIRGARPVHAGNPVLPATSNTETLHLPRTDVATVTLFDTDRRTIAFAPMPSAAAAAGQTARTRAPHRYRARFPRRLASPAIGDGRDHRTRT
jgi:hypothetical protein